MEAPETSKNACMNVVANKRSPHLPATPAHAAPRMQSDARLASANGEKDACVTSSHAKPDTKCKAEVDTTKDAGSRNWSPATGLRIEPAVPKYQTSKPDVLSI